MKSESIRKNLESMIVVSYTDMTNGANEENYKEFDNTEINEAIKYARKIKEKLGENVIYLDVELLVYNASDESNSNIVFIQSIPFEI